MGRFTQPDTIIPNAKDPQAYDRFAYVNNNPINSNDPSGHGCAFNEEGCANNIEEELVESERAIGITPPDYGGERYAEVTATSSQESPSSPVQEPPVATTASPESTGMGNLRAEEGAQAKSSSDVTEDEMANIDEYGDAPEKENNVDLYSGVFEKHGVKTVPHFFERIAEEDGVTEDLAWKVYNNGTKYTDAKGQLLRYDPKTKITVIIDPSDGTVVSVSANYKHPSQNWKNGWIDYGHEGEIDK